MKAIKIAVTAVTVLLFAGATEAQNRWTDWGDRFRYDTTGEMFRANELTLDLFGSYRRGHGNFDDFFDNTNNDEWGGGIGLNYFFTRHLGVGVDASAHTDGGSFVDNVHGSAILRFPLDAAAMAPYVFGGGGYNFHPVDDWSGHAGLGVEFRLNPMTGIFTDARYIWGNDSGEGSQIRAGLRFAF